MQKILTSVKQTKKYLKTLRKKYYAKIWENLYSANINTNFYWSLHVISNARLKISKACLNP